MIMSHYIFVIIWQRALVHCLEKLALLYSLLCEGQIECLVKRIVYEYFDSVTVCILVLMKCNHAAWKSSDLTGLSLAV